MKLNLGCGQSRYPEYIGVDQHPGEAVDVVVDLEQAAREGQWPWPDNSVTAILASHSLEHMGADFPTFLRIWQEIYRICAPGALVQVYVPDPLSEAYFSDPTHCRPYTPQTFRSLDRAWMYWGHEIGAGKHTDWGLDFQALRTVLLVHDSFSTVPESILKGLIAMPSVVRETYNLLVAHKPMRNEAYLPGYTGADYEIAFQGTWDRPWPQRRLKQKGQ